MAEPTLHSKFEAPQITMAITRTPAVAGRPLAALACRSPLGTGRRLDPSGNAEKPSEGDTNTGGTPKDRSRRTEEIRQL